MKLPVKQILSKNRKHYQIVDREGVIIIPDIPRLCDAMQIEDSLNAFQTMYDLLKSTNNYFNKEEKEDNEEFEIGFSIKEFLKQYEL